MQGRVCTTKIDVRYPYIIEGMTSTWKWHAANQEYLPGIVTLAIFAVSNFYLLLTMQCLNPLSWLTDVGTFLFSHCGYCETRDIYLFGTICFVKKWKAAKFVIPPVVLATCPTAMRQESLITCCEPLVNFISGCRIWIHTQLPSHKMNRQMVIQ